MAEEKAKAPEEGVNVQVLLRCRPLSEKEIVERAPQVITCNEALREVTLFQNVGGKQMSRTFRFDRVFGCDSTQEKLFKQAIIPIVQEVMDGFNCTIFAYGQTGTGKTYTMEGGPRESDDGKKLSAQAGVIPRSIKQIFDCIEESSIDSTVKVSFLELYNEELTDLLSFDDDSKKLRLLEDRSGVVVQGLEEVIVRSAAEIYQVLDRGTAKRRTAATLLNNRSSRSHSIFTITIHMKETTPEGEDVIKIGKLNLVDLAGSENISRSGAKDSRAREAGSINQSLLTLGRVITALVEHSGHVPYRDSKLTRLLRDSLGGRTKTCIIATIAPTVHCQEETISTLDYAHRAKNIRNRPELNQKISKTTMIKELATEIEKLKLDLVATREKNGVYLAMETFQQNEMERAQLRETVKALRAEAEAEEANHTAAIEALKTAHATEVANLQEVLAKKGMELSEAQDALAQANIAIQERAFVAASLKRAEQALAVHAEALTRELDVCTQDIAALFARMDEVSQLEGNHREALGSLQALVAGKLQTMGGLVDATLSRHAQYTSAVASDLGAFKAQKQQDVAALKDQVEGMQSGIKALEDAVKGHLASLASSTGTSIDALGVKSQAMAQEACAAAEAAQNAAASAISALTSALEAQSRELQAFASKQDEAMKSALASVSQLSQGATTGLQGAANGATAMQASTTQRYKEAHDALGSFAQGFEEAAKKQQEQLLQQIGSLVAAFNAERSQALAGAVQSLQARMESDCSAAVAEARGVAEAASTAAGRVQEVEAGVQAQLQQVRQHMGEQEAALRGAAHEASRQGTMALQGLQQQASAHAASLQAQCQAVVAAATGAKAEVEASAASGAQQASTMAASVANAQDNLGRAVSDQHAASIAMADTVSQMVAEAGELVTGFTRQHQAATAELSGSVSSSVGGQLGLSAQAPAPLRRDINVPPVSAIQDLMCPPEDVVLQQLRNARKDMLKRGGDGRLAGAMLLSPHPSSMVDSPPSGSENAGAHSASVAASPAIAPPRSKIPRIGTEAPTPSKAPAGVHAQARAGLADRTNA